MAATEQLPVPEARAGDPAAWDALFRRFQLPLYVYVFELRRDEQASLDLVQETFIAAIRHLGSLRDDDKFGSWLFAIGWNQKDDGGQESPSGKLGEGDWVWKN
jgi:RNA polymerase sigma-70 factor (ECF subfamily)